MYIYIWHLFTKSCIITLQEFGICSLRYVVYCIPVGGDDCDVTYKSGVLSEQDSQLVFSANENGLPLNCKYTTVIETMNKNGHTNSTGNLTISKR